MWSLGFPRRRVLIGASRFTRRAVRLALAGGVSYLNHHVGQVAERLKAPHSKCGIRATVSGVRIPPSPPIPNSAPSSPGRETWLYGSQSLRVSLSRRSLLFA